MKTTINNISRNKYFSVPNINSYDLKPRLRSLKKKSIEENCDNNNFMYKSVIIDKNTKKIGSDLGESYLVCNNDTDVSDLRKSEYNTIKKQDKFAKFSNGKKYIKKGKDAIITGSNTYATLIVIYSIGKYLWPFLL
uniref:Uncharacterized protein n=1 Tax=Mimivirus LCMiAC02 TaxID=2506609 RepID=A0A481Z2G3_9VIRU|nr:MAG: hypothetical protein LCMiAC02_05740 [Mimivirus LCMiAC02]